MLNPLIRTQRFKVRTEPANIRWPLAFVGCIGLSWMLRLGQHWVPPRA